MKKIYIGITLVIVTVLGSLIYYGCTEKEEDLKGTIYGTVTDYATGEPVGNVSVKLRPTGEATLTGSDGTYEFKDLEAGKYSLLMSKAAYADLDDDYIIELQAGKKVKRDVQIRKRIASLQITDMAGNSLDTLDFGSEESVTVKTFNLFNDGTESLTCTATYDCEWVTNVSGLESAIQPGETRAVTVRIDRVALADGVNTTFLYIISGNGSNEVVIKATFLGTPVISTEEATNVTANSATIGGNITDDGGRPVTVRGICYGTSQTPTIDGSHTEDGSGTGAFSHNITGLSTSTTYYARAYAINRNGTYYASNIVSFITIDGLPTVTTTSVSNVTATTAKSGGNVTANGGYNVTARGICWNTMGTPDLNDQHTTNGSGNGTFTSNMTGLTPGTTYYVRAYATNQQGTVYGTERSFTTTSGLPTISTTAISATTATTAKSGGTITDDGGFSVTARGVCWNTMGNPDVSSSHTTNGTGTGTFTSNLTGLTPNTTYHVRAYATNSTGTAYGNSITFSTSSGNITISISSPTNITASSASCSANITNDGGSTITTRGICWSTSQYPTSSGSHTAVGSGTGSFSASMTGLTPATTYYVRAYATNAVGTSYSSQVSFTTTSGLPVVTTGSVSSITANSAVCSGDVTSDGGFTVTAKGLCWSTTQYPTVSGSHSNAGSGTGSFNSSMSGLSVGTTYYVRAYATNSQGTAYGTQQTFTTSNGLPSVATTAVSGSSDSVVSGGNVTDDGGYPVTARGICYGVYPNPDISNTYTCAHTSDGTGTGYFTSLFDSVITGTVYVRAYATNANGTAYGNQIIVNMGYMRLPTFVYGGNTYRVAPDPGTTNWPWGDAVAYCASYIAYGYSDWRLPTLNELQTMCANKYIIGGFYFATTSSLADAYWCSDNTFNPATGSSRPWYVTFNDCTSYHCGVGGFGLRVRPIRVE